MRSRGANESKWTNVITLFEFKAKSLLVKEKAQLKKKKIQSTEFEQEKFVGCLYLIKPLYNHFWQCFLTSNSKIIELILSFNQL